MPKLLTLLEAARLVGAPRCTVNEVVLAGGLPAQRLGRQWFVAEKDVLAWGQGRRIINREPQPRSLTCDRVLAFIADRPGCHAGEIAAALGHPRRRVQERMQELELDGLIVRHVPASPTLPWTSELTPRGEDVLANARSKGAA